MAEPQRSPTHLLTHLLRDVSRSFYLTLRILPAAVRPQIGLAYLFARATDTIADTEIVPVAERLDALDHLRARILGSSNAELDLRRFTKRVTPAHTPLARTTQRRGNAQLSRTDAERVLLERIDEALAVLTSFAVEDQERIREVLAIITSGQELDLRRFGSVGPTSQGSTQPAIAALKTDAELDDYTYRVAGCVGEFWTRICRAHLFPAAKLDDTTLLKRAVCFGKGLQLVNVLRDFPADLRMGRCYLPLDRLAEGNLEPVHLLSKENEPRFRPLYSEYLDRAETYLAEGWAYTNSLPYRLLRVRLACAWPILIGIQTLAKLRSADALQPIQPVKISRKEVKNLIVRSLIAYPLPRAWRRLFNSVRISSAKPVASSANFK
jgi:farnesyl-diphosphate farnesyltransferase